MRPVGPAFALLSLLVCGCSFSVHEVAASGFTAADPSTAPRHAKWIHAQAEQGVILGITDNTDYVDRAYADLLTQCPGDVVGMQIRFSTRLGFLSWTNVIDIRAMCLAEGAAARE